MVGRKFAGFGWALVCLLAGTQSLVAAAAPVGRLAGALSVNPHGQATYSIPIKVPAGTNGLAPKLSLDYSSTTAHGIAGVGWSLGGASAIVRCSKAAVLDGNYATNITLSSTDSLCLDGARLLTGGATANSGGAGIGAVSTGLTYTVYTTQLQNYKKITATVDTTNSQPQSFTVTTKDGLVMTYGGTTDSRVVAAPINSLATGTPIATAQVVSWLLNAVTDRNGNTMTYSYTDDSTNSSAVLSSITYTSNSTVTPAIVANKVVNFDYGTDTTVPYTFIAGSRVHNNAQLTTIRVSTISGATTAEVRRYSLTYRTTPSQLTLRPLLASVQECDTYNGVKQCLNPTSFTWADGALNFATAVTGPAWADTSSATEAIDIVPNVSTTTTPTPNSAAACTQGGGKVVDGVCVGTADTWNGDPSYFTTIKYADIDGDGKTDICGRTSDGMQCYLSTGAGFSATALTAPNTASSATLAWSDANGWNSNTQFDTIQFADLNGDGRADICGDNGSGLVCYLSLGATGFDLKNPIRLTTDFQLTGDNNWSGNYQYDTIQFIDLDQDGRSDVCGVGPSGLSCYYLSESTAGVFSFVPATLYNSVAKSAVWSPSTIDFSYAVPTLVATNLVNNKATSLCARTVAVASGQTTATPNGGISCVVVSPSGSTLLSAASPASGTSALVTAAPAFSSFFNVFRPQSSRLVDINGDGFPDLCAGSSSVYFCIKNPGMGTDFLNSFMSSIAQSYSSNTSSTFIAPLHFWEDLTGFVWLTGIATGTVGSSQSTALGASEYATLHYLDINHDGLADVCERSPDGFHCRTQQRYANTCTAMLNAIKANGGTVSGFNLASCPASLAPASTTVWFSTDDGYMDIFESRLDLPVAWSDANGWNQSPYYRTIGMADINGDGYPDVCGRGTKGITCYLSSTSPRDLITSITDGYGLKTTIAYKTLTDYTVYTKGTSATYPDVDVQPAMTVVATVQSSNGVGGQNQVDYTYTGLVNNVNYGSQGFSKVEVRDEASNRLTDTYYQQTFPYTGLVTEVDDKYCSTVTTVSASCTLLHKKTNTWAQTTALPSPYTGILPYTTQSQDQNWDMSTTP